MARVPVNHLAYTTMLALALAGCGSSDDSDGSATGAGGGAGQGAGGNGGNGGLLFDGSLGDSPLGPLDATRFEGGADAICGTTSFSTTRTPANILFVVDRSGSMNCNA